MLYTSKLCLQAELLRLVCVGLAYANDIEDRIQQTCVGFPRQRPSSATQTMFCCLLIAGTGTRFVRKETELWNWRMGGFVETGLRVLRTSAGSLL